MSALVVAVNYFEQTPLVMRRQVFVDQNGAALLVGTVHFPEVAGQLMGVHFLPFESDRAAFLKQTLALVRTVHWLQRTMDADMVLQLASLHHESALVLAFDECLRTIRGDMVVHVVQREHQPTLKQTFHYPIRALLVFMRLQVFPKDLAAYFIVRTLQQSVSACFGMLIEFTFPNDLFTVLIGAIHGQF